MRDSVFGTDEPPAPPRRLCAGHLAVAIADGGLRGVFWNGIEVLRGVDYPVRDPDWGTHGATTISEAFEQDADGFGYSRRFTVAGDMFTGSFQCRGSASGRIDLQLVLTANRPAKVNRAGFVVLHPIAGVAGTPLLVTHSDGTIQATQFPQAISPVQPVLDIAALRQAANGVEADIVFSGETFEMEDQRNWSDASYKTYCRPLSRPYPYGVQSGEVIEQRIGLVLGGSGAGTAPISQEAIGIGEPTGRPAPEILLALESGWEGRGQALEDLGRVVTLLRLDLTAEDWQASLTSLVGSVREVFDLEIVVADAAASVTADLVSLRAWLERAALSPRRLSVLPKAYLKSYQPQAAWPPGLTPEQAILAARTVFPGIEIGGGMLTNFTELNRYPGAAAAGDFITHGTTAIVHAADDLSVMQTLEALPQIFASAETLAPAKPYRLGLVSIGMRSNPYGGDVAANPTNVRRPMAMADPRQRGLFAAAWMVGAVAATAASRVQSLALAAPAGPLGLIEGDSVHPAYHVFSALCRLAGQPRLALETPQAIAAIAVRSGDGIALILANLGAEARDIALPALGNVLVLQGDTTSPRWLSTTPRRSGTRLSLHPYGVAFVSIGPRNFFGSEP